MPETSSEQNRNFLKIYKLKNSWQQKLATKSYFSTFFIFRVHICSSKFPANKYMFNVNNRNFKKCAKYATKTPERRQLTSF